MKGKKLFKQIASIITMILLLQYVSILAPLMQVKAETATVNGIDWTYEIDSDGNAIDVKPTNKSQITGNVTIPSLLDGHSVISIGEEAFMDCEDLTVVEIPEGVTSIENWAFAYCSALESIKIPSIVTSIGQGTFWGCESLTSVEIPEGVTSIESYVLGYCTELTSIKIPSGVTSIGEEAFEGCSSLISIEIPNSVTTIGSEAFSYCTSLEKIEVAEDNQDYTSEDGVLFNKERTEIIKYPAGKKVANYIIPKGVTSIGEYAFDYCSNLKSIEIQNSVTSIGAYAFVWSDGLTNIVIPDSVWSIGEAAFYGCESLTSIEIPSSVTSIGRDAFKEDSNLVIECEDGSYAQKYAKQNNIKYNIIQTIKFKDSNLYNKILAQLQNEEGRVVSYDENNKTIKVKNVSEITSLDLSNTQISNLTGIDKFTGLKKLNLSNNNIEDISTLENLDLLIDLNLDNNKISDISILDNKQFDNLTIKNQKIEMSIMKYTNELPNIILNATENEYSNGDSVSLKTSDNCSINGGEVAVNNNFTTNDTATITVSNGVMAGTVCTIKTEDVNNINVKIPNDSMYLIVTPYKNGDVLDINNIDIYYSVDNGTDEKYKEKIELDEGKHNISVKFFGYELENITINSQIKISAIRKNGKVYIFSNKLNSTINYSLTSNSELTEYTKPFITDATSIFVKVGENNIKEVQIEDMADNEIYDTKTSNDVISKVDEKKYEYNLPRAIRKNGIVYVNIRIENGYNYYYNFGGDYIEYVSDEIEGIQIRNYDADTIYIKQFENSTSKTYYYTYKIADYDKFSEILGIYNNNGNSYIFSQDRKNTDEKDGKRLLLVNNENKIEKLFNEEILDVTDIAGNVFILRKDEKVYKIGNSYDDLQLVRGSENENFIQINGIYALNKENKIYKCSYDYNDNTYTYSLCENYTVEDKIEKLLYINVNNEYCPYVLYENGKAVILNNNGTSEVISNKAIDISTDGYRKYALEYDKVQFKGDGDSEINLISMIVNEEIPVKINKEGTILTDKGNYYKANFVKFGPSSLNYLKLGSYSEEPTKTNIAKLGDYTYQDSTGRVYYIENDMEISKKVDNIEVTKDEGNLSQNKVSIKVNVPENTYTIKLPDGTTSAESNLEYEVTENGVYTFEFTDSTGYSVTRIIHVTNIQNRKETKVPEVTSLNGNIKLESDEKIEYSLDKENWTEYKEKIEYTVPIYARIKNEQYECSILKITLNEDGKLDVENTEERQIEGKILTNGVGQATEDDYKDNIKVIEYETKVEEKNAETNDKNKNFFDYVSEIADNIIYSFSSTDGQYAGCYFEDDVTETTYKDINNNVSSMQNKELNINDLSNNNNSIDYGIIKKTYNIVSADEANEEDEKQKKANGEIYSYESYGDIGNEWKETIVEYAYINSQGNLISNIDIINKAKEVIGENTKYTKIVGDGGTFYILTQEGEVYLVTQDDNGTYNYFAKRLNLLVTNNNAFRKPMEEYGRTVDVVYKLELRNIIDIYDTCTALTKDGKVVSLLQDNEKDNSVVQELQNQTDKYLIASHLGLKDGKLYNFDDVKRGVQVTAGKIVKTESNDDKKIGIYSKSNNKIKLFYMSKKGNINVPELSEGESYITVEGANEELPEFIDIAEYTESYLTNYVYYTYDYIHGGYNREPSSYENADEYAMVYALAKDGEIWAYMGDYVVDTGVNLDYFGPTANYSLSTDKWTNKNINLNFTENTTNKLISIAVKKQGESTPISTIENKQAGTENTPVSIATNGEYILEVTDSKGRTYTSNVNIMNIDKIAPVVQFAGKISNSIANITAYDKEPSENYAKSGIAKIEMTYETPTADTKWIEVNGQADAQGKVNASITLTEKNKVAYVRTIDNAGNVSEITTIELLEEEQTGKVIVKYQDEDGNSLKEDLNLTGNVGDSYKVERQNIDGYELIEVIGNEEGKYKVEDQYVMYKYKKLEIPTLPQTGQGRIAYLILGIIIIICIGTLIYYKELKVKI